MPDSLIKSEIKEKICVLSLNNPEKRNVLTVDMLNEITYHLDSLAAEDKVRCVVIRGEGGKAFSSGYDISAIKNDDMIREFGTGHPLEDCLKSIENFMFQL